MAEGAAGEDEGWKVVVNRRRRGGGQGSDRGQTTFFFRNFPPDCTGEDLWHRFEKVGRVVDLFIPSKKDKWGSRFGFVRFQRTAGDDILLDRLNRIWIGSFIIRASKPRFERSLELRGRGG